MKGKVMKKNITLNLTERQVAIMLSALRNESIGELDNYYGNAYRTIAKKCAKAGFFNHDMILDGIVEVGV